MTIHSKSRSRRATVLSCLDWQLRSRIQTLPTSQRVFFMPKRVEQNLVSNILVPRYDFEIVNPCLELGTALSFHTLLRRLELLLTFALYVLKSTIDSITILLNAADTFYLSFRYPVFIVIIIIVMFDVITSIVGAINIDPTSVAAAASTPASAATASAYVTAVRTSDTTSSVYRMFTKYPWQ